MPPPGPALLDAADYRRISTYINASCRRPVHCANLRSPPAPSAPYAPRHASSHCCRDYSDYELVVRQQPKHAKICTGNDKRERDTTMLGSHIIRATETALWTSRMQSQRGRSIPLPSYACKSREPHQLALAKNTSSRLARRICSTTATRVQRPLRRTSLPSRPLRSSSLRISFASLRSVGAETTRSYIYRRMARAALSAEILLAVSITLETRKTAAPRASSYFQVSCMSTALHEIRGLRRPLTNTLLLQISGSE